MRTILSFILITIFASIGSINSIEAKNHQHEKLRVMMTSDFPPIGVVKGGDDVPNTQKSDPDDMQSMVRFLLYANEFDIEGLIASAGTFAMEAHKKNILGVLDEYEKVYDNLKTYDQEYPSADDLRSVTYEGKGNNNGIRIKFGCGKQAVTDIIGEGLDSEASNAIIAAADKPDPRPLWIGVWGGPREIAQAIWDVQHTRSEEELNTFISKLRIFLIGCQDATHEWMMNEFPDLFIVESRKTYQGMFGGHDPKSDLAWINENIRFNHGPLCDVYPHEGMGCTGVCEGDSPAFLYLLSANRGINNPEDPTQASWGGQYARKGNTNHYVDGPGKNSISKWREDYQKEFQERADRCIKPKPSSGTSYKPRIIVTSDGEIDDECSMVRFLLYANEFDIEGIVTTSSQYHWQGYRWAGDDWIDPYLAAYKEVYPNLVKHDADFPSPSFLRNKTRMGNMSEEGEMDTITEGSQLIVDVLLDDTDTRPIWLQAWGGFNTISRALRTIEEEHPERMAEVANKIRMYGIFEQDSTFQSYILPHWGKYQITTIISDQFEAIAYRWKKILPKDQHQYFDGHWMRSNILPE